MKLSELKNKIIKKYGKKGWQRLENLEEYKKYVALEEEQIENIKKCPISIKYINNPSENIQLLAVKQDGYVIEHIDNPSEKIQLEAVKKNVYSIACIHNPTDKVIQKAIKEFDIDDVCNLKYIFKFIENDLKGKK